MRYEANYGSLRIAIIRQGWLINFTLFFCLSRDSLLLAVILVHYIVASCCVLSKVIYFSHFLYFATFLRFSHILIYTNFCHTYNPMWNISYPWWCRRSTRVSPFAPVGWFSRALAFCTFYYPWGKMGNYSCLVVFMSQIYSAREKIDADFWPGQRPS